MELKSSFRETKNANFFDRKYRFTNLAELNEFEYRDAELNKELQKNATLMAEVKNKIVSISRALYASKVDFPRTPEVPLPF